MSLPVRQERELQEIEGGLSDSDPRLRSLFAIFSRLTRGEAMPRFEVVPPRPVADRVAAVGGFLRRITRTPGARARVLLLLPAALGAMVCAVMFAAGFLGVQRAAPTARPPAARELVVKSSRMCRLAMIRFPAFSC
jgi:hypothetical protein